MMRRKSVLRPPEQRDTASQREECCGIRLLHPERQSLREQHADGEPVRYRHHRGGPARRQARHALGLDRGAPFQLPGRAVLPGSGARLYRRANEAHPARARGDGAAAASSDPRRRAMGHARSAQQRARGFRGRTRLRPAGVPALPRLVRGQSDHLRRRPRGRAQIVGGGRSHLLPRQALFLRRRAHHAKPVQRPIPAYIGSFSKPSIELAARFNCGLIVAPFAAAMSFGGLQQVADLYHDSCAKYGNAPQRLMCSYFTHFADTKAQEDAQRARQIRYYRECVIPALPGDPKTAPPSYRYFVDMVARLQQVKPEDLTENSVLLGSPQRIIDTLKKVEGAGFSEVILYFNVGLKPHQQVKDEMARFMEEVAPA